MSDLAPVSDFDRYRDGIVEAAGYMYGTIRRGEVPDSTRSRVSMTPIKPGDAYDAREYMIQEAKLNVAVRSIVGYCVLMDDAEQGGFFRSRLARTEMFLRRFAERAYLKDALGEGGVVEAVRQPYHPDTAAPQPSA